MDDLDEDTGQLWHTAAAVLDVATLQQAVAGLAVVPLARSACWFPLQHIPPALQALLQPYRIERERPTGWRWDAMPPSWCFPDGLIERLSQRLQEYLANG